MKMYKVAVVRYENPFESVRKAVELSEDLDHLPQRARVFIKPNIVFWTRAVAFNITIAMAKECSLLCA